MKWPALSLLLACACVPTTEDKDPRGAAGVSIEPGPAARGEPFVTPDGWTVRFERLGLLAMMTATTAEDGQSAFLLWDASTRAETYRRAFSAGPCRVAIQLEAFVASTRAERQIDAFVDRSPIDATLERRFRALPDNDRMALADFGDFRSGPGIVFTVRGERAGEVVTMDLALTPSLEFLSRGHATQITVVADDVRYAQVRIAAERLFEGEATFERLALADRNGDRNGQISARELASVRAGESVEVTSAVCDDEDPFLEDYVECRTLLDALASQADQVFVAP